MFISNLKYSNGTVKKNNFTESNLDLYPSNYHFTTVH